MPPSSSASGAMTCASAGVVVEILHGVDDLPEVVTEFRPGPTRRLGVLVDHLVPGSKEEAIASRVAEINAEHVLVTGHPYVDVWQAVKPAAIGIKAWPQIPRGTDWKTGVCAELGWPDPATGWRTVLAAVNSFTDLEVPLLTAVEQLIDFVTGGVQTTVTTLTVPPTLPPLTAGERPGRAP